MKPLVTGIILEAVQKRFDKLPASIGAFDPQAFAVLKEDIIFIVQVGHLLSFCEKDTIFDVFHIDEFRELPDGDRIENELRERMLDTLKSVYLTAAKRIKSKYKPAKYELDDKEKADTEGTAHHILGVFTSLLQMYYAVHHDPRRLEALVGSPDVLRDLAITFKKLHPGPALDSDNTFRKWAFISLFHDIAKIEETYSPLKHDVTSARFLADAGIFDMLALQSDEKEEAELIIQKHVEIGCHGPGDQSVASLKEIFHDSKVNRFFTHEGGNVDPEKLSRFLDNALLMWTHDSAGTTRKGLATSLPFYYLRGIFGKVSLIAAPRNLRREMAAIDRDLDRYARRCHAQRIGRIICAWLKYNDMAKDGECAGEFARAMERVRGKSVSGSDIKAFEEYFPLVSGKNHLFNMLVHPIREYWKAGRKDPSELAGAYEIVVKGFVLLTKALKKVRLDDVRAVNNESKMELNEALRTKMAQRLCDVIAVAHDVRGGRRGETVELVSGSLGQLPPGVEMKIGVDEETKRKVLFVVVSH